MLQLGGICLKSSFFFGKALSVEKEILVVSDIEYQLSSTKLENCQSLTFPSKERAKRERSRPVRGLLDSTYKMATKGQEN